MQSTGAAPSFRQALRFWLKLGFISFGGPAGQIAVMHTELVERKKWIDEDRFMHALNFCMLLPGPEATQLAIYCGWLLHRMWGGIVAGVLFVLPGALLLWVLSYVYAAYGHLDWIAGIFYGLKPAVTAIVAAAVIRLGRHALKNEIRWTLAGVAFVAIYFFKAPFPAIVAVAALAGYFGGKWFRAPDDAKRAQTPILASPVTPTWGRSLRVIGLVGALWFAPVALAGLVYGWHSVLVQEGMFFSKAALVTFGGAYAVLPYVADHAVQFGWILPAQMMDGTGLAETTPGPLIIVLQFVGFLGAWHRPGGMEPLLAGTLGAAMTTWTTFVPCFLWVFLGAPHIERIRSHARLSGALAAVTAAVVGVILNLAVWFGQHTFTAGGHGWVDGVDWFAVNLAVVAFAVMQWMKIGIVPVVLACGAIGLGWRMLT